MHLFCKYGVASGQFIIIDKCNFYAGSLPLFEVNTISVVLGFPMGTTHF